MSERIGDFIVERYVVDKPLEAVEAAEEITRDVFRAVYDVNSCVACGNHPDGHSLEDGVLYCEPKPSPQAEGVGDRLADLAACMYQFAGVHGASKKWLDVLSAAANGEYFSTEGLLPYPGTNESNPVESQPSYLAGTFEEKDFLNWYAANYHRVSKEYQDQDEMKAEFIFARAAWTAAQQSHPVIDRILELLSLLDSQQSKLEEMDNRLKEISGLGVEQYYSAKHRAEVAEAKVAELEKQIGPERLRSRMLGLVDGYRAAGFKWIDVKQELPPISYGHNYLVWVTCDNKAGGYRDLAAFGDYLCEDEDCGPEDPNYVADNDEGNRKGSGWHREEETHGGPYDSVFIDLSSKVTHWAALPEPPREEKA